MDLTQKIFLELMRDQNTMAIPLHNKLSKDDYEYIVETLYQL